MSPDSLLWFRSKVDWWIAVVLVILPLVQVEGAISALRRGDQEALIGGTVARPA